MFATARRCLQTRYPLTRHVLPAGELPGSIDSDALPPSIRRYILSHLKAHKKAQAASTPDPDVLQIAPPRGAQYEVDIPNPFVLQNHQIESDRPYPDLELPTVRRTIISPRKQKKLLTAFPRHVLPPSSLNPMEAVPRIRWVSGGGIDDAVVNWTGEWKSHKPKGLFSNKEFAFKGHKRERQRGEGQEEREHRMKTMDERVRQWRAGKASAKETTRPSIPF